MQYFKSTDNMIIEESKLLKNKLKDIIEDKDFESKFDEIEINNNIPFTFNQEDYKVKEGTPMYTDSNKFGKSGKATAIISKNTISKYTSEDIEYPNPINFEKILVNNKKKGGIFQRCHIIGYNLSAKFMDFNNIFIGTNTLNHNAMKKIEDDIHDRIEQDDRKILYKVTPIYKEKNILSLMEYYLNMRQLIERKEYLDVNSVIIFKRTIDLTILMEMTKKVQIHHYQVRII